MNKTALSRIVLTAMLLWGSMFGVSAAEADLLRYLPAGVDYLVSVNIEKLLRSPGYARLEKESEYLHDRIESFQQEYNLKLSDCSRIVWVGGGKYIRGVLIDTSITEVELATRLSKFRAQKRYREASLKGKKIYLVQTGESIPDERRLIGFMYLSPNVLLVTEDCYFRPFLQGLDAPEQYKDHFTPPANQPLGWGFLSVKGVFKKGKKNQLQAGLLNGLKAVFWSVSFVGVKGTDLQLGAAAECRDAKAAQMLRSNVINYLALGSMLLFGDNPELGTEVLSKLKLTAKEKQLVGNMLLKEDLLRRLGEYFGAQAAKRILAPDQAEPGTASSANYPPMRKNVPAGMPAAGK